MQPEALLGRGQGRGAMGGVPPGHCLAALPPSWTVSPLPGETRAWTLGAVLPGHRLRAVLLPVGHDRPF